MAYGENRNSNYRSNSNEPREMFDTTCSDCGGACQVPFKPTDGRPVYCRDCFQKHRPADREGGARRPRY